MNLIIQTCVPDYRVKVYNYITEKSSTTRIISGKAYYSPSIKSSNNVNSVEWINNYFFLNRRLLFQSLPWRKVFLAENVVIEFNLRNISLYPTLIIRFLLGKNVYLWGHAWSRSGKNSRSEYFRFLFKLIADGYIAYTDEQRQELKGQLKNKKIFTASNAIYYKNEMVPLLKPIENVTNFIYVGRLIKDKKPLILIKAFQEAIKKLPFTSKLLIVGTGPESKLLLDYISENGLKDRIILSGHIYNQNKLRELYSKSVASVSPGYVGLSITQSLGFGVPMIISKNEPHSPELEAAIIGENSEYFETDDIHKLSDKMVSFYLEKEKWYSKRNNISKTCRNMYSVERMAVPFLEIFKDR